jgi:tripartite-type tricarboxylate transporter receptor subunit TctC
MRPSILGRTGLALCLLSILTTVSWAQEGKAVKYPTKPIDIIVPWTPGGGTDMSARVVAAYATKKLGVSVNVVNLTGASGVTGMMQVLKSKPDGYTFLMDGNVTSSFMFATRTDLPVTIDDRTYIARATTDWVYYFANIDSGWKTLVEAITFLKSKPEEFRWGAGAYGSSPMFSQIDLFTAAGIEMEKIKKTKMVVFEKGNAPSIQACVTGDVQFAMGQAADVASVLATKRIRVLGVNAPERTNEYPDIPTAKEQGYPDAKMTIWYGVSGPKGSPEYVVRTWDELIRGAMKDPEAQEAATKAKKAWTYLPSAEYKAYVLKELQQTIPIATALGIRQ